MIPKLFFCTLFLYFQCICMIIFPCGAALAQLNGGPAINAMGNTGAAATGIWSMNTNPAGITTVDRPCLSLGYSTIMGLPELATQDILFAIPVQRNRFGIAIERYGFSAFNLLNAGFVYGKQFGGKLSIAARFNLHQVNAAEYGATSTFSFDLGFRYVFKDKIALGAYMNNPTQQEYSAAEHKLSVFSGYSMGLSWPSSDQVLLVFSLEKGAGEAADFRTGLAYTPTARITFRGGLSLQPLRHYAGFQVVGKSLVMDFAISSDSQLGYHPQIAISYAW